MSKSLALSLGGLGAGAAGVGGLLTFKPWETQETFATKYKHALLDTSKDSDSWNNKYTALKQATPKHPKLLKAVSESKKSPSPNDAEAKKLMREGCKAIYESPHEKSEYLNDFKKYCSKTNQEASTNTTWNTDNVTTSGSGTNKWDTSLTSLKSHNFSQKGNLVEALVKLKEDIKEKSTFEQTHRERLKNWCDKVKTETFMGSDSLEFKNQDLYCKGS
ncbi:hypothetical protein HF1_03220 [Mycoplasma haemofelis str. Langford 1]|uniref:Uncharacterized protein n=1 Tax=Mycoplasma haemofelis (strain Langford 1) TaxID=941640 RepID=E8ZGQ9_MYCHL|nr:hypothetical protein [Mycoplasma haemofelis]CBY92330.1 hypothetical protein HF1_03220 [Mycoplasma haemofelis str. Langford 1]